MPMEPKTLAATCMSSYENKQNHPNAQQILQLACSSHLI